MRGIVHPGFGSPGLPTEGGAAHWAPAWAEAYQEVQPAVQVSVTGGGTGTGMAALINGTLDIANASRRIKPEERSAAEANGISPVEFVVARDAIAVIVHPANPEDRLP